MAIKLTMIRERVEFVEEHGTLAEALESVLYAVESNTAAPVSLTMPATVIGNAVVTFDANQLYLMSELVARDPPENP